MFSPFWSTLIFGVAILFPFAATPQGKNGGSLNYDKELGSPADGRFRPNASAGWREAYLPVAFPSSHSANLLQLRNGDLLCFWFSGTWEGESDVGIVVSRLAKGSQQWSAPQVVDHRPGESYQNPVPFEAPDGTVWLIHTTQPAGRGQAKSNVLVAKSRDGGKTWAPPTVLFDNPGAYVRGALLITPKGDWMLPMYVTPSVGILQGAESNYSVVKISSDKGASWQECAIPDSKGLVQPTVVRLNDGTYKAFFRSRWADFIYQSTSRDECSWAPPQKTLMPNNNSSVQAAKLANGHLVIAFNNASAPKPDKTPQAGPRKPLTVALSADNGQTWPWVSDVEAGVPDGRELPSNPLSKDSPGREEYSYPSILRTPDGKITLAYTYQRYTIKTVKFDEEWIKKGKTAGSFKGN